MTKRLQQELLKDCIDPALLIQKFTAWKALGQRGEDDDYNFGKDGMYSRPAIDGKMVLRHVHLPPENDSDALAKWDLAWERYSRRVSDFALIYAEDKLYGYLLIAILSSPDTHLIPKMKTQQHRELMHIFAEAACYFIHTGKTLL